MAATGNRTLKLSILADVDDLKKKLDVANTDVDRSAGKLEKFGNMAKGAFLAAAAAAAVYATKLAVDGVKAAIEDEAAQLRLASALRTATGATSAQIAATEAYILKTSLAVGVTDDELRPAFQRLAVSTNDVSKSQTLLNLAIDIAKGTGKPLAEVTDAIAKAYDGNTKKLASLGIGLSAADLKTMSFTDATQKLTDLYGGAATRNADTFQGRIDRLKVGFSEAKEEIGAQLLPIIEKLVGYIFQYGVPLFDKFKAAADKIKGAIVDNQDAFRILGEIFKQVFPIIADIFGRLYSIAASVTVAIINIFGTIVKAIEPTINFVIASINKVITALNAVSPFEDIAYIPKIDITKAPTASATTKPLDLNIPSVVAGVTGGAGAGAGSGTSSSSVSGSALSAASIRLQAQADAYFAANPNLDPLTGQPKTVTDSATYNITVNGAIDSESSARQIVNIIQESQMRGGVARRLELI
jgi:hypothetical protein